MKNPLQKAIDLVGGQTKCALLLTNFYISRGKHDCKIYQSHIGKWLHSTCKGLPAEHCRAIEEITQGAVTRYDLRPDVFGTAECPCTKKEII